MVLEPHGVEVERRRQVQDVWVRTLQQVRNAQLRAVTERHRVRQEKRGGQAYTLVSLIM